MEQMAMTIKTEVEAAETADVDSEIDLNFLKQDSRLLQSVKRELTFTNDVLVKGEILEDSTQDDSKQLCVQGASRAAGTGDVNAAYSASLGDLLNVKNEPVEMDIGPTVLQHMDTHYTINKNMSAAVEENTIVDDCNEATPGGRVKEESVEVKWGDEREQQCVHASTPAGASNLYQTNSDRIIVKQELEEIDIGPIVLQHMDIHYALNKSTVDGCQKAMRCSGVNKSVEHKLRDNKINCDHCGQTTTDYDEAHLKSCLGQKKGLQQCLLTTSSNSFRCNASDKTFHKPYLLSAHRKLHERNSATSGATSSSVAGPSNVRRSEAAKAKPKPFKCNVCDKGYSSKANLSIHKRFHSGSNLSVCHICSAKFNLKINLTTHLRTHTGGKPYQCDTCNAKFTTNGVLTIHKRVHTGEKPYQCDTCNARFAHAGQLTTHKRVHTGNKPYQCDTCNSKFTTNGALTIHKRVHTGEKPYQCDTCNGRFTTSGALTTHKRLHTGEMPYQCDTCNARFAHAGQLTTHKRVHTGNQPYQCGTCYSKFTTNGALTIHKRVHTGEKPYQCDTCNARFTTSGSLTTHKRLHTGEKPYQCDTCNVRFITSGALTTHKRGHSGENLYQCDTCYARFTTSGALTAHESVHSDENPYQCDTCYARFTTSGHLTTHKKVHTGEKLYQCDICHARFADSSNLTRHKRVHTGEKPY